MNCDTFLSMREGLQTKVWVLNRWLFDKYNEGLDDEQVEVITDGELEELYGMLNDMGSRMGVPQLMLDEILYWRFPKEKLLEFVLSHGPLKSDMYND